MVRSAALTLLAAALLAATPTVAAPAASGLGKAWVRASAAPGRPWAGYFTVTNGAKADRLVAITVPDARVEMHSMTMKGDVMRMEKLDGVSVPAGGKIAFAPGGNHLMIFDVKGAPKTLPVTLVFASGAKLTVNAPVQGAAAPAPAQGAFAPASKTMDHGKMGHDGH